jgi:hypothetical protein
MDLGPWDMQLLLAPAHQLNSLRGHTHKRPFYVWLIHQLDPKAIAGMKLLKMAP